LTASPSASFFLVFLDFAPPSCGRESLEIDDTADATGVEATEDGVARVWGEMVEGTVGRANEEPKDGRWLIDDPDDAQKPNGVVLRLKLISSSF
jgi:hypothetical protein